MAKKRIRISLKEIDLSKGKGHLHPDIVPYKQEYLAKVGGQLFMVDCEKIICKIFPN